MNKSLWTHTARGKEHDKLNGNIKTEILIVGGGIAGLTTAYLLAKKGLIVTLVEADYIGYGASGRNTGKVNPQHNIIYSKIYKKYGKDKAREYFDANNKAIDLIENIITEYNIKCDYEKMPSYLYTENDEKADELLQEFNTCKELGIECEYSMEIPLPIEVKGAIKFNYGGQFHPKKYVDGLRDAIDSLGVHIYERTPVKNVDFIDKHIEVTTIDQHKIETKKLIICSHFPFFDGLSFYFARLRPDRSHIVAGEYSGDFPKGTFINVEDPRRSLRIYEDGEKRYLLIGGENHRVGVGGPDTNHYERLKNYGKEKFGIEKYRYNWSAQDYITSDKIPYIGYLNSVRDNVYVATGFAKWGMTNGTVAAMIISELISDDKSVFEDTFSPSRHEGYTNKEFIKNNIEMASEFVKSKFQKSSAEMPKPGEGKVVTLNNKKYGAYRDQMGKLYIVDITCTHVGCELKWNITEKTWDCPCHGSRFSVLGSVLEGPATVPLNKYGCDEDNTINPNLV